MAIPKRNRKAQLHRIGLSHHVTLAPQVDKELFYLAEREGRSLSDLVREAIVLLLDNRRQRQGLAE